MELVGNATKYHDPGDGLRVVFLCTNQEEFDLRVLPTLEKIPPDRLVRAFTKRPSSEIWTHAKESILVHWEDL